MKTGEKLAAGWLLTLGFMFLTLSVSAAIEKHKMVQYISPGIDPEAPDFRSREAYSALDLTTKQGLIFGIPTLALGGWLAIGLYRQSRQDKKALEQQINEHLQSTFYRMIQENNGHVTLLGFAMQSHLPAPVARQYLDEQAKVFNANYKISEEGGISYHFDL
ncbi:hypothetical protein [Fischerella thermalis]|uniref:Uncharacterized protein n=1 Tax=Fischerella thermalis CCMEE 5318 TaxID=2019666 RepID=A0A2N6L3S3_9CYAN|nr:hypothetical protein [Fischerella thermalis]PMB14805.1 hypothetical protein CEN46_26445 [Fischerella thermalis CCMEE 5318]PMB31229.1 hypothetical protein CEN47_11700 [Fischerella thermalis CCMEE 5319]